MSDLKFKIRRDGGTVDLTQGGEAVGDSHNDGGVKAVDREGTQVAEIEDGERIFSVDHTQEIEEKADEISRALENDDNDLANELAIVLGFRVVEMIAEQEKINPS